MAKPLTPTTYGRRIYLTFYSPGAKLVEDGPDEIPEISRIRLRPACRDRRKKFSVAKALARARANPKTNWGQRAAEAVCDAGNAGKISKKIWPVGKYAIFGKTIWLTRSGGRHPCFVFRTKTGFDVYHSSWFTNEIGPKDACFIYFDPDK